MKINRPHPIPLSLNHIHIIVSNDNLFLEAYKVLPLSLLRYPENGMNATQLEDFVRHFKTNFGSNPILTSSVPLLLEFHMSCTSVMYHNYIFGSRGGCKLRSSTELYGVGDIEILSRANEQMRRYLANEECPV